ncbi:MAG: DUF721 domain-containing protein [Bacteroidales bacterium]
MAILRKSTQRKGKESSVNDIMDAVSTFYGWNDRLNKERAMNAYALCVDADILRCTENFYIKDRTLHLQLNSAAAKSNLQYQLGNIKMEINRIVGTELIESIILS